jgi:hypothetical protein
MDEINEMEQEIEQLELSLQQAQRTLERNQGILNSAIQRGEDLNDQRFVFLIKQIENLTANINMKQSQLRMIEKTLSNQRLLEINHNQMAPGKQLVSTLNYILRQIERDRSLLERNPGNEMILANLRRLERSRDQIHNQLVDYTSNVKPFNPRQGAKSKRKSKK